MKILPVKWKIHWVGTVNKKFNPIDILRAIEYSTLDQTDVEPHEKEIINIMLDNNCTLSQALQIDFDMNLVDTDSVIGMVDYLELKFQDLNKVAFYMDVYTGRSTDFHLTKN